MNETIIKSDSDSVKGYLHKIWKYRFLIWVFGIRDLKTKYAQTLIGLSWTIIQPLTALIVFTFFFDFILDIDTGDQPYILFVFSGLSFWSLFSYVFIQGSTSLLQNRELNRKLYFPKILLPLSKVLIGMVEFGVAFIFLLVVFFFSGGEFHWKLFLSIIPLLGTLFLAVSLALLLSAATVKTRDLQHIVPFLVNFGIWLTPVFYPVNIMPSEYADFIYLNPMAGFIDLFRWCLNMTDDFKMWYIGPSFLITLVLNIIAFFYFKKAEDIIVEKL